MVTPAEEVISAAIRAEGGIRAAVIPADTRAENITTKRKAKSVREASLAVVKARSVYSRIYAKDRLYFDGTGYGSD
jgi:hypothetical protein